MAQDMQRVTSSVIDRRVLGAPNSQHPAASTKRPPQLCAARGEQLPASGSAHCPARAASGIVGAAASMSPGAAPAGRLHGRVRRAPCNISVDDLMQAGQRVQLATRSTWRTLCTMYPPAIRATVDAHRSGLKLTWA